MWLTSMILIRHIAVALLLLVVVKLKKVKAE